MTSGPTPSVFTKIIERELPAHIVYENETLIAFLTIDPLTPGHTLIVPKKPFTNIFDGDEESLGEMMRAAKIIGNALVAAGIGTGVNLLMNNGAIAGQEVFHAHLHVIPRNHPHEAIQLLTHHAYQEGEAETIAETIASQLS